MRLRAAGALSTCKRRETRRLISGVGGGGLGDWYGEWQACKGHENVLFHRLDG